MVKRILNKILSGIDMPQEYICIEKGALVDPLKVFVSIKNEPGLIDVTATHLLLGYKPLLIGIPVDKKSNEFKFFNENEFVTLRFNHSGIGSVARISLKKTNSIADFDDTVLFLYEGMNANHYFVNDFYQVFNKVKYKLSLREKDEAYLSWSLYQQVRVAYSFPRAISLMSLGRDGSYNLFPTDLNGKLNESYYVMSLRKNGKASDQVKSLKKIIVSTVQAFFYKTVYQLGKNHMNDLQPTNCFPFSEQRSEKYQIPLPQNTVAYQELELINTMEYGIHCLCFFKIIHKSDVITVSTLSHVHAYYAMWRKRKGFQDHWLIR